MAVGSTMKIAVAYIRSPRGFKGELAASLYNPSSENLKPGGKITIKKGDRSNSLTVEYIKTLRKGIGIKLEGIDDEETAESWRGAEILMELDELEALDESEFYEFEIEGAEVFESEGGKLGIVDRIENSTGNSLLVVKGDSGEILIPFVAAIVKSVDIENKKIVIEKLEGLY